MKKETKHSFKSYLQIHNSCEWPDAGNGLENTMGILNEILNGIGSVVQNSWTAEEKAIIIKSRDLLKAHGLFEEAGGLDKVISKFAIGFERRSGFDPDKRIQPSTQKSMQSFSAAELAYELKDRLPGSFGSLDTIVSFTNGTSGSVTVKLRFLSSEYARFEVNLNGHLIDQKMGGSLYEREYTQATRAIITALKEIRKEMMVS